MGRRESAGEEERPRIEPRAGTYALRVRCGGAERLRVGALGRMETREGDYLYVGSALGPGGVEARVRRHRRRDKPAHWHVDYLREVAELREVWVSYDSARRECAWARVLTDAPRVTVPLQRFGASDCRCPGHLFRVPTDFDCGRFRRRVQRRVQDHAPIYRRPGRPEPDGEDGGARRDAAPDPTSHPPANGGIE